MPSILLTNYYSHTLLSIIRSVLPSNFSLITLNEPTRREILSKATEADYFLVGGRIKIDEEIIAAAKKLKMVQRTGVGLDSLDLTALKKRGIPLYVNPGVNARSVAEHTLMLILAVMRRLALVDHTLKSGKWMKHETGIQNNELYGKTVGLVGLGNIGRYVALMLRPFGVRMIYCKRHRLSEKEESRLSIAYRTFQRLIVESDIISLHCPLTPETKHMLSYNEFSRMKPGAIVINTSRGKLIDEEALIHHLKEGTLKGAGLDVFEHEPVQSNNELLAQSNVVLTPHIGGITSESFNEMMYNAFQNIYRFENGDLISIEGKKFVYE